MRRGSRSWSGWRLTATGRSCGQRAASWQACCRTQRPIGMISPPRSAAGMNCPGSSRPRCGCCQRMSASALVICPVARSTMGWYQTWSCPARNAASSSAMASGSVPWTACCWPASDRSISSCSAVLRSWCSAASRRHWRRSGAGQGLDRKRKTWPSLTAAIAVSTSAWPVSRTRVVSRAMLRRRARNAAPSMSGIRMSLTTTSNGPSDATSSSPDAALVAVRMSNSARSWRRSPARTDGSSSTRRTRGRGRSSPPRLCAAVIGWRRGYWLAPRS